MVAVIATYNIAPTLIGNDVASTMSFDVWVDRWSLTADGAPIRTAYSDLLPVVRNGVPAMLKIARTEEERRGASLSNWYAGDGAVRALEIEGPALLMERPRGNQSLAELSHSGHDDQATKILCATVQKLHTERDRPPPEDLVPLDVWFRSLASTVHPLLARSLAVARELLADTRRPIALHGDIHHGNVLYDNDRGWLAIDPKGLRGEPLLRRCSSAGSTSSRRWRPLTATACSSGCSRTPDCPPRGVWKTVTVSNCGLRLSKSRRASWEDKPPKTRFTVR